MRTSMLSLMILAACGGGGGGGTTPPTGPDPMELGSEVTQAELETTIKALAAMPTRYTLSQGDEQARDYLVGRIMSLGLVAELEPFQVQNQTANNIIVKHMAPRPPTSSTSSRRTTTRRRARR